MWNNFRKLHIRKFCPKYDHLSQKQLTRGFRELKSKSNYIDNNEIRCVSQLIRRKYVRNEDKQQPNHDEKITSNFLGNFKGTFETSNQVKQDFDKETFETCSKNAFKQCNFNKTNQ